MIRKARIVALALALEAVCVFGIEARTQGKFTGVIRDNQCVGPACATMCPVDKDPVYTLQTPDGAWVLSDSRLAAKFAGQKVTIQGTTSGNRLKVSSVTAAN